MAKLNDRVQLTEIQLKSEKDKVAALDAQNSKQTLLLADDRCTISTLTEDVAELLRKYNLLVKDLQDKEKSLVSANDLILELEMKDEQNDISSQRLAAKHEEDVNTVASTFADYKAEVEVIPPQIWTTD